VATATQELWAVLAEIGQMKLASFLIESIHIRLDQPAALLDWRSYSTDLWVNVLAVVQVCHHMHIAH
jgi:hypothetical protein